MFDPAVVDPTVSFLADLARDGDALELGIGTGRIALPLSRRGVRVHGIDLSPAMLAQLRAKPGADAIGLTIGDFATTKVDRTFRLAYLVFNTIMNLTTQDEQVECFRNVAAHLEPGGCFVIEVGVPDLQRLPPGETVRAFTVSPTRLGFDEYDVAAQILFSHHYWAVDGQLEVFSAPYRYVWPTERDLRQLHGGSRRQYAEHQQRPTRRAVHVEQPHLGGGSRDSGLLAQLPHGRFSPGLADLDEAARQAQFATSGLDVAAYHDQAVTAVGEVDGEQGDRDRQRVAPCGLAASGADPGPQRLRRKGRAAVRTVRVLHGGEDSRRHRAGPGGPASPGGSGSRLTVRYPTASMVNHTGIRRVSSMAQFPQRRRRSLWPPRVPQPLPPSRSRHTCSYHCSSVRLSPWLWASSPMSMSRSGPRSRGRSPAR